MLPMICVITNDPAGVFQRHVIEGIRQHLREHDFDLAVAMSDPQKPSLPAFIPDCAGVIVLMTALNNALLAQLYHSGKPVTLVSHNVPGLPVPAIMPGNTEGIARLVDYLVLECGCKQFVFIQGDMHQLDGQQRDEAFRWSLIRHNLLLPETHLLLGNFSSSTAAASVKAFLQTKRAFDAVVAADYLMACAALEVLRAHGKRVPQEVCVAGFGDGPEAEAAGLTTVAADIIELGRRAARQLLVQVNGLPVQGVTWLNTDVIKRHTCCEDL